MSGDSPDLVPALDEITAESGIAVPNAPPYTHITFVLVAWNEEERLGPLLEWVRPFFSRIIVGVQESQDNTLEIARRYADLVIEDAHLGYGDATFGPKLQPAVLSPWMIKVDADEWPSTDLLGTLSSATWYADHKAHTKGVWLPFRSSVEGVEYEEQHAHLRLFHSEVPWPAALHSRPAIQDGVLWQTGHIRHDRSLDELVQDYLRYLDKSGNNVGWIAHNKMMIRSACEGTAAVKGWDFVMAFEWWEKAMKTFGLDRPWDKS